MARTRVVLVGLQGIVRDIVRSALREREVDVVSDLDDESQLDVTLSRVGAGCVLWRVVPGDPPAEEVLYRHPRLKIVTLESDGKRAFLHQLRPRRTPLGELSPALLAEVVESAGR